MFKAFRHTETMAKFIITVVSDTVCPWCYVGKRRMEAALAQYRQKHPGTADTFTIDWKPFYLNPDAPKQGIDKAQYYKNKFGEERTAEIFERLAAIGRDVGINFKFGGKTGNTRDSHRLIQLAKSKSEDTQDAIVQKLFEAYFENEQDITSHDVLRAAAVAAGLAETEVTAVLNSNQYGDVVDKEVIEAKREAINGVPHFKFNDTFEFSGAQEPAAFIQLLERLGRDRRI